MRRATALLLAAILAAAAVLRFMGLAQGLRHTPHMDERYFVDNVCLMLSRGDLDHRFYEYPGLFFYVLYAVFALAGAGPTPGPGTYLAARAVVAAFGVLNVLLVFAFGSRVAGRPAGLLAAALLAVSPVEVETAHMVRPDIVLASLVLLALLAFRGVGEPSGGDVRSGLALGAAAALKFTGVLLVPSYLAHRLLAPGRRSRGVLLAFVLAAAAFTVLSPYAVIHARDFLEGARTQVTYHYRERPAGSSSVPGMLLAYSAVWLKALGIPGAILAAAGLFSIRRDWRAWVPLLVLPAATLAVFSTQEYRFERHMLPSLGVVALLAGVAVQRTARWHRAGAGLLAAAAAAFPLASSIDYLRAISTPAAKDVAVDWVEAHVRPGSRVLTTIQGLGLDRSRFEVLHVRRLKPRSRLQVTEADVVVTSSAADETLLEDIPATFVARSRSGLERRPLSIRLVPRGLKPAHEPVALDTATLTASQAEEALEAVRDGRLDTRWEVRARRDWLQAVLPESVLLARVELLLGNRPDTAGRGLRFFVSVDGSSWTPVAALPGRPRPADQIGAPSQVFLFEPVRARGLRIVQAGGGKRPWGIAELRLHGLAPAPPSARRE